jgi:hypothetical protein
LASRGLASSSDFYVDANGTYRTLRPVVAAQAECLALCGLFWLGQWLTGWRIRSLAMTLGVVFSGVAALTQHRSFGLPSGRNSGSDSMELRSTASTTNCDESGTAASPANNVPVLERS